MNDVVVVHHTYFPDDQARIIYHEQRASLAQAHLPLRRYYITEDTGGQFEFPGIHQAWTAAQSGARFVGYMHTKGASHPDSEPVRDWRRYMQAWFNLGPIRALKDGLADVSGVNYQELPFKHFSGNFWWASGEYLRRFPEPTPQEDRMYWEKWVCSLSPRIQCLHMSGVNHYHTHYPNSAFADPSVVPYRLED